MKVSTNVKITLLWVLMMLVIVIVLGLIYYFTYHSKLLQFLKNYSEVL